MVSRLAGAAAALLLLAAAPASAFERWYPVFGADFLGGQTFFDGNASSWAGNAEVRAIPAYKFNESLTVLPMFDATYNGTRDVTQLADGATLFQSELTASFLLKPIYQVGRWKLKPYAGYRIDDMRETTDETLSTGLFDYRKTSVGAEAEYIVNPQQWASLSLDYFTIRFPNYSSLESQVDPSLGRENAGAHVLDTDTKQIGGTWNTDTPVPNVRFTANGALFDRSYVDQPIVDSEGQLETGDRDDTGWILGGGLEWTATFGPVQPRIAIDVSQTQLSSNQNHYDASVAFYSANYYSYSETMIRPRVELWIKKNCLTVSYLWDERDYANRPAQDASGTYTQSTVWIRSRTLSLGLSIPLGKGFKLIAESNFNLSDSNQLYQILYQYNYNLTSQLIGFAYDF